MLGGAVGHSPHDLEGKQLVHLQPFCPQTDYFQYSIQQITWDIQHLGLLWWPSS